MQNVQRKPLQPEQISSTTESISANHSRPKSNANSVELASIHSVSPPGYATPLSSASTNRGPVSPLNSNGSLPNTFSRVNSNAAPEVFSPISDGTARRTSSTASTLSNTTRRSSVPPGLTVPNKPEFRSLDAATLVRHEHNTYLHFIAPREREDMMNLNYRLCQRKAVRVDQFGLSQCARCKHYFPTDQVRICAGDNCNGSFCEHCFPQASVNHIHGPSNFRCSADVARPDIGFLPEGWRALQNNDAFMRRNANADGVAGRLYYMHERSKNFTFFKPALPKTLPPGWTTALDTQGKTMYIDPNTRTATYVNPLYGVAPSGYELKQNETGRLFYVNRQTGTATWHKPLAIEPLPTGWEAGQTPDGRIYYINHVTKTNTWTKPTSPAQAIQPTVHPVRPSAPMKTQSAPITTPTHQPIQMANPVASTNLPVRPIAQRTRPPSTVAGNPMAPPSTSAQVGTVRPAPTGVVNSSQQTMQPRPSHGGSVLQAQSSSLQGVVNSVQPLTSSLPNATVPLQPTFQQSSPTGLNAASDQARPPLHSRIFSAPSTTSAASAGAKLQNSVKAIARSPGFQSAAAGLSRFALRAALSDGNDTGDSGSTEFQSTESTTFVTGDSDLSQSQIVAADEQCLETPSLQTQDVSPNPAPLSASSDIVYAQNSALGGEVSAPTYVYDSSNAYLTDNSATRQGSDEYTYGSPQLQYIGDPSNPQILPSKPPPTQIYSPTQSNLPLTNDSSSLQMPGLSAPQYQSDNNITYVDYTSQPSATPQIVENNNTVVSVENTPSFTPQVIENNNTFVNVDTTLATEYQQQQPNTSADIATPATAGFTNSPYDPSTQYSNLGISDYNNPTADVTNGTFQSPATSVAQVAPQYDTTLEQSIMAADAVAASEAIAIEEQNASLGLI
ncbi:MAG: hypothetical protein Q9167_002393 [Letrouitia subvulpina]